MSDLDSFSSSLLYAYLRSTAPPAGAFSPVYIPLLNIPQSGIRLRPEFAVACQYAGITTSSLLNLDDIEAGFKQPDRTRWILVDHNKLQGSLGSQYSEYVSGVIDHHDEEHAVPSTPTPEPRIVGKAGSCTSLIIRRFRATWDAISDMSISSGAGHGQGNFAVNDSAYTQIWDAQIAKLALASILIDTANLTAPGKVEDVDRQAVRYLDAKINLSPKDAKSWDRTAFFNEITSAKTDIEHLSLEEILIKHYKEWTEKGHKLRISSVVKPLAFLVRKGADDDSSSQTLEQVIHDFMTAHDLSLYAIMTAYKSEMGQFQRELLLQANNEPAFAAAEHFSKTAVQDLGLEVLNIDGVAKQVQPHSSSDKPWRYYWMQGDLTKSRKQVAPMLREALRG